ncbi:MAG TPA: PLP-dependent aminotransferase family protein [Bryobacteraceae bacterium]|nr:PLP-dependent aminotransferase family protein [Bryobacteraceae bacterium]
MFLHLDRSSHIPIYVQIKESVRALIVQGTVRPGDRLPSTRQLSGKLGINRMTVEAAFSRLEAEGLISSHVGRGTFVNGGPARADPKLRSEPLGEEAVARMWTPLFTDTRSVPMSLPTAMARKMAKSITFVPAAPGPDLFPAIDFRRCADFVLKRRVAEISAIGSSDGLASLKSYLVRWFGQNGMGVSEEDIVITTGCQQSMDLIGKIMIGPGDSLVLENPTYPGAVAALAPTSTERLQLPVQEGGPDLRTLTSLLSRNRCKLIYSVPNFHNPTGRTIPLEARRQFINLAAEFRVPIVEDDVFGELRYDGPVLPTLRSLRPDMVIYIGSFSKMLTPAIRLGWIVAPRPVIRQINMVKQATDLHTNLLIQAILDEFCRRDLMNRHMKRVRRIFKKRRDALAEALHRHFPHETRFEVPDGGLSMWVTPPPDCDVAELLRLASGKGVKFLRGSAFYFRSPLHNSLRLSFAAEPEERIKEGIRILGSLLRSNRSSFRLTAAMEREGSQPIL